MGVTFMDDGT
ncbi:hypothetical protein PENANT_c005G05212 [Penicillium antarcticum]|uniref:Uncharacterized protein n=1 Tax=Penicillium antarcticum TaxID=416450 RepID=A0A1V6QG06_9EURO|nr:hypothetical protein PENANT_c005G05212 [Penicillium antarcticum]